MQAVFPTLIAMTMGCFVASTWFLMRWLSWLKRHHRARWEAMDRPSAIRSTPRATAAIFRFLARREWLAIDDPVLARRAARTRQLSCAALLHMGLTVLWVLVLTLTGLPLA